MNRLPALVLDSTWALGMGIVIPVLVLLLLNWRDRQRRVRLARYGEPGATARLLGAMHVKRPWRTARLLIVALLVGLALAGPRWGLARGATSGRGIDMTIAMDASLSMTATDDRPSRLERMKQEVRRLRAMSRADRVALIAFAGRSYILTPLTGDDGALELFLDNLDPTIVGQAGSSVSRAIRQGTELLLASDGGADRALIIMTDGESFDTREDVESAAADAGKQGISLVTVGFGTLQGSTIPIREGNVVREKRDDDGKVVVTRYEPALLEAAAKAANGSFIPAEVSDKAARIRGALRSLRTARRMVDAREDHVPRFTWLLVPAFVLLILDTILADRGSRPVRQRSTTPAGAANMKTSEGLRTKANAAIGLLCVLGAPLVTLSCARAPDPAALFADGDIAGAVSALREQLASGDTSALTRYNLGSALLAQDSLNAATELLESVRRGSDEEVRIRSRFNSGLARLIMGRDTLNAEAQKELTAALAAYRSYLSERPADADAKWNYELALRKPPPPSGGGGGSNNEEPETPESAQTKPSGGSLDPKQAEALLNSAAREERDVQGRKQKQGRTPPPGGKDW